MTLSKFILICRRIRDFLTRGKKRRLSNTTQTQGVQVRVRNGAGGAIRNPNGCYHVNNRGHQRRVIFWDRRCYEDFIKRLGAFPERFGVRIHTYVLRRQPKHEGKIRHAVVARDDRIVGVLCVNAGIVKDLRVPIVE